MDKNSPIYGSTQEMYADRIAEVHRITSRPDTRNNRTSAHDAMNPEQFGPALPEGESPAIQ